LIGLEEGNLNAKGAKVSKWDRRRGVEGKSRKNFEREGREGIEVGQQKMEEEESDFLDLSPFESFETFAFKLLLQDGEMLD